MAFRGRRRGSSGKRGGRTERTASDSFLSEDRDGHQSQNAAPSKKFAGEIYPAFFLQNQIPRLIAMKTKSKPTDTSETNSTTNKKARPNPDEQLLRITNDLEYQYRNSGYFVHSKSEVNRYYERNTPYLYEKTKFPEEISSNDSLLKHSQNQQNETYFLFEEDEQKIRDAQQIQRMISISSQTPTPQSLDDDDVTPLDQQGADNEDDAANQKKKRNDDVVELMDDYYNQEADQDEEDYEFEAMDDDEGVDGGYDEDVIDGADEGMDDW